MPRLARLDAPGVLHHIMIRGIERRKIFRDSKDRDDFVERLSIILPESNTSCYAWALLSNHAHFLFRSGEPGISKVMRRLLTGYSGSRKKSISEARSLFCYWCVRELGENMTSMAKLLGLTQPAIGYPVDRGE